MGVKSSQYNLFFKAKDGRFLLFNALSRTRVFVDEELKRIIQKGKYTEVGPDMVDQLVKLGIAEKTGMPSGEDSNQEAKPTTKAETKIETKPTTKTELQKFTEKYKKRVVTPFEYEFTLIFTTECNLSCYYCDRSRETMSHSTIEQFKKFFSSQLANTDAKNVAVRIVGGEPLLYPETLVTLLQDLREITIEHKKEFFSGLATNGTLLTEEILTELTPFLNAVQVTFEGCREYHNSIRVHETGTFDKVLNSAHLIKNAGILLNMRIHITKENIAGLEELFHDLHSVGVGPQFNTMITVAPVIPTGICPLYPVRCTETPENVEIIPRAWEKAKKSGLIISGLPHPPYEMLPCPYTTSTSVVVDTSGTVYQCLMAANTQTCAAGSIQDRVLRPDPFTPGKLWPDTCTKCQLLPLCGGGCTWRWNAVSSCGTYDMLTSQLEFHLKNEHPLE
jgi:radical SAM protein with 4Fe4S-binding SPASM domain